MSAGEFWKRLSGVVIIERSSLAKHAVISRIPYVCCYKFITVLCTLTLKLVPAVLMNLVPCENCDCCSLRRFFCFFTMRDESNDSYPPRYAHRATYSP